MSRIQKSVRILMLVVILPILLTASPVFPEEPQLITDLEPNLYMESMSNQMFQPPKIRFAFLLFPDDLKVDAARDLTLCLVNIGAEESLYMDDGDHLALSIPVGGGEEHLIDAADVGGLGCTPPSGWTCSVDTSDPDHAVVELEPVSDVLVPALDTTCFDITGVIVNSVEGAVFPHMSQHIDTERAVLPDDLTLSIFKSIEGTIEHDDLAKVMPDQHHIQTWDVNGDDTYSLFSGNVGIGTMTPQHKLHVAGQGLFNGEIYFGGNRTSIVGFDGANNHWIRTNGDEGKLWMAFHQSGGDPDRISIVPGTDFDLMTGDLSVNRNVTVGAGPGGRLFVRNTGVVSDLVSLLRTDNSNALRISTPHGDPGDMTVPTAVRFKVSDNNASFTEALNIVTKTGGCCEQANIGIGEPKPQARLHVYSDSDVTPAGGGVVIVGDSAAQNIAIDGNEIMARNNGSVSTLFLQVEGGKVGIGTNSIPEAYIMAVDGAVRTKEIVVETGWSDYVFEEDYDLRPLEDVASFIEDNGHLPDVPTAEEVEDNGVPVGEMSSTLLRKIEELTLYMLEMDREIKDLKEKNRELEAGVCEEAR